jgi:uncharacterized membrane protein
MYLILKWLHILSAVLAVGANATYFIWLRASTQDKASTRFALNGIERLGSWPTQPTACSCLLA